MTTSLFVRSFIITTIESLVICGLALVELAYGAPFLSLWILLRVMAISQRPVAITLELLLISLLLSTMLAVSWTFCFVLLVVVVLLARRSIERIQKQPIWLITLSLVVGWVLHGLAGGTVGIMLIIQTVLAIPIVMVFHRFWEVGMSQSRTWYIR